MVNNKINSSGYSNHFLRDTHCVYKFSIPQETALQIEFQLFDLKDTPLCR